MSPAEARKRPAKAKRKSVAGGYRSVTVRLTLGERDAIVARTSKHVPFVLGEERPCDCFGCEGIRKLRNARVRRAPL
jgi:hypothetical protein